MTAEPIVLSERRPRRPADRSPLRINVEQGQLMATCMNATALAREVISRNGEIIRRLAAMYPPGAERQYVLDATHAVHDKAVEALNEWLIATDRYESIKATR